MSDLNIKYCDEHFELLAIRLRMRHKEGDKIVKKIEKMKTLEEKVKFALSDHIIKDHLNEVAKRYGFELVKLIMESGFWKMKLVIRATMPKVHRNYQMIFTVNLDNVERSILNTKKAIANEENQARLLPEETEHSVAELKKQLENQNQQRADMIEKFKDIVFTASVEEVKNKSMSTEIVFSVPANVIEIFNEHRMEMSNYHVELRKI